MADKEKDNKGAEAEAEAAETKEPEAVQTPLGEQRSVPDLDVRYENAGIEEPAPE